MLPQGFCPSDFQSILNAFSNAQFVNIAGISSGFVVSATPPADHTVAWLQLDSLGRPTRVYFFAGGAWLSLHPQVPGQTIIWTQPLPNFTTFDGGDATVQPFSAVSGQMWQLAANALDGSGTQIIQARSPLGVGTLTSGTIVNVNDTGGEEKHILTDQEMPPHTHTVPLYAGDSVNHADRVNTTDELTAQNLNYQSGSTGGNPATGNPPTAALAHNNMGLWYGVYFLQRTSRLFYVVKP
jgi:microcystin-dependent protein